MGKLTRKTQYQWRESYFGEGREMRRRHSPVKLFKVCEYKIQFAVSVISSSPMKLLKSFTWWSWGTSFTNIQETRNIGGWFSGILISCRDTEPTATMRPRKRGRQGNAKTKLRSNHANPLFVSVKMLCLSLLTGFSFCECYTGLIHSKVIPTTFSLLQESQNVRLRLSLTLVLSEDNTPTTTKLQEEEGGAVWLLPYLQPQRGANRRKSATTSRTSFKLSAATLPHLQNSIYEFSLLPKDILKV